MNNDIAKSQQRRNTAMGIKDKYLEQLESDFQLLSQVVLSQMDLIHQLLSTGPDGEIYSELERNEKLVNSLDLTLKEKVVNAIMLFTPRAGDLRRLMGYSDMTISMERVGDLTLNISEALQKVDFSVDGFDTYQKYILKMFNRTYKMLKSALSAYTDISDEIAYSTILMDDKIDKMEKKIEKRLAEDFGDKKLSSQALLNVMNLNAISYHLERIGDKAVDISTSAIFLIEGKNVRHNKAPIWEGEATEQSEENKE